MANTDVSIDSVRRSLNLWNVCVSGVGRGFSDVQAQLGGVGRTIFEARIPLGEIAVGSLVKLNENGSPVEFYVSKHDYESGLNGVGRTLLVHKDCYDLREWNGSNVNVWPGCTLFNWLNGAYLNLLDEDIRSVIGTTKYYYTPGNGNKTVTIRSDAVFQLSVTELGKTASYANAEGTALPIASTLQIAYLNGSAVQQWTRSPVSKNTYGIYLLDSSGYVGTGYYVGTNGSRPAFTLPASLNVSDDGTILV